MIETPTPSASVLPASVARIMTRALAEHGDSDSTWLLAELVSSCSWLSDELRSWIDGDDEDGDALVSAAMAAPEMAWVDAVLDDDVLGLVVCLVEELFVDAGDDADLTEWSTAVCDLGWERHLLRYADEWLVAA